MTAIAPAPSRADLGPGRVTQVGVIRSEWIKLRSLRSTWYSLLADRRHHRRAGHAVHRAARASRSTRASARTVAGSCIDATQISLRGVFLAQLAIGVLGVLVITGEYSTGMIRSSIAAVPHRQPVLVAKALVFAVRRLRRLARRRPSSRSCSASRRWPAPTQQASLSTPGAGRAIFGGAIYLTLIGLLAIGLGFLIRNTAGAIAALFGIVLVRRC